MRQSSLVKPHTQTAQRQLHPVLQNALTSLDSQLEDELAGYRRQRALGKGGYPVRQSDFRKDSKTLDSIPITADELSQPSQIIHQSESLPSNAVAGSVVADLAIVATATSDSDNDSISNASPELQELAKQYASRVAAENDLTESLDTVAPDDYLESSEELLRSLAEEEADVQTEQRFMQSLLTPMGVGSMLLLLVSSVLFGFVIMNPASLTQLFASRNAKFGLNPSDVITPSNPDGTVAGTLQPNLANQEFPDRLNLETLGSLPVAPNSVVPSATAKDLPGTSSSSKAAKLGLSGHSSTSSTSKLSNPAIPPAPKVNQSAPDPASVVPRKLTPATSSYEAPPAASTYNPPSASSYSPPTKSYSPPARSYSPPPPARKSSTPPAPPKLPATPPLPTSAVPTQSSEYPFKVVTPYTGDRSLEEARSKVPDVFVKSYDGGAKNQFGAFKDEAAAKARADELRQQGVPAEVYKP